MCGLRAQLQYYVTLDESKWDERVLAPAKVLCKGKDFLICCSVSPWNFY